MSLHCLNLSNNSGSVEMWNVEKCLPCLVTLEVWKCGNMSSLSSSSNSGSEEMWKCEICLQCLYQITLEVQKYISS